MLLMATLSEIALQYVLDLVSNRFHIRFDCGHTVHNRKAEEIYCYALYPVNVAANRTM